MGPHSPIIRLVYSLDTVALDLMSCLNVYLHFFFVSRSKKEEMDIRGAVDAAVPTNIIAAKAAEVRANKVNWQSYLQ